ncbi:heterokaryon incompatibility [Fusarium albosuccineum]|uniref:Heterokaryon incompatibility n=1 Tax=Fusarium albosuccineum TaxID=1237068 RepID=A0A8H4P5N3_9HYPO|nr:heterokaryon incompatibility [Fusarium albosuccineum]
MEAAGLVLGALGISGLFTACIQNFDIVLDLQRIRLVLWGESLGLVPGPSEKRIPYHTTIERDDIRPAIESTLSHLCLLLQNAEAVTGRYELKDGVDDVQEIQPAISTGLTIFRDRFESFKARIRKNQKTKSTWAVTRWAVHDYSRFKATIGSIKDLMDGLESITSTIGALERQQALLTQEVGSISDTRSLRLLQEVASSHETSPSLRIVSSAASFRLSIAESSYLPQSNKSKITGSSQSFYTAPSQKMEKSLLPALGEDSSILNPTDDNSRPPLAWNNDGRAHWGRLEAMTAGQQNYPDPILDKPDPREGGGGDVLRQVELPPSVEGAPQNQRVISNLISKMPAAEPQLKFDSGSLHYGEALAAVKQYDEEMWKEKSTTLVVSADKSVSAARRVFLELRSIRNAGVPFISAAPVGDGLDTVLASIEGPSDTPYEGGIFKIDQPP